MTEEHKLHKIGWQVYVTVERWGCGQFQFYGKTTQHLLRRFSLDQSDMSVESIILKATLLAGLVNSSTITCSFSFLLYKAKTPQAQALISTLLRMLSTTYLSSFQRYHINEHVLDTSTLNGCSWVELTALLTLGSGWWVVSVLKWVTTVLQSVSRSESSSELIYSWSKTFEPDSMEKQWGRRGVLLCNHRHSLILLAIKSKNPLSLSQRTVNQDM